MTLAKVLENDPPVREGPCMTFILDHSVKRAEDDSQMYVGARTYTVKAELMVGQAIVFMSRTPYRPTGNVNLSINQI